MYGVVQQGYGVVSSDSVLTLVGLSCSGFCWLKLWRQFFSNICSLLSLGNQQVMDKLYNYDF